MFIDSDSSDVSVNILLGLVVLVVAYTVTTVTRTMLAALGQWCGVFPPEWYASSCWIPWRPLARKVLQVHLWWMEKYHGKKAVAGFAGLWERMTLTYKPGMVYLGQNRILGIGTPMPVGMVGRGTSLLVGASRSGKSAHLILRLALNGKGGKTPFNVFAFDCDGTLTHVLARRFRSGGGSVIGKGGNFCCLDPNGRMRPHLKTSRWNVFVEFDRAVNRDPEKNPEAASIWALKVANALVVQDNQNQPFFAESSRTFLKGLLLFVYVRRERKTLVEVRELLVRGLHQEVRTWTAADGKTHTEDPHDLLFFEMQQTPGFGDMIISGGALGKQGKTKEGRNTVLGTALAQLSWIDDPTIAYMLSGSDFSVEDLKTGDLNLTLVAPITEMQTRLAPWYRLLLASALYTAELIPEKMAKRPVLYALDEFCAINMPELHTVPSVYPKHGVICIFAAQQLSQIQAVFGDNWENFINNADSVTFLATESPVTIDYLFEKLGTCTHRIEVAPELKDEKVQQKAHYEYRERPVMTQDDIRRFLSAKRNNAIVLRAGERALKLKNGVYFRHGSVWQCHPDPDPKHNEPFQRAWARRQVEKLLASRTVRRGRAPLERKPRASKLTT